jgi:4-aminobutyrate aminotransferase/(S)-3-amino-2-methylpropionate transaminase
MLEEFVQRELEAFENYLHNMVDATNVAAVILELVQGEGGFVVAPKEYVAGLHKILKSKGILLIVDEVQTGFGRTGKWCAYEHYDIVPDISTWAKSMGSGMPIGAVIGRAEVMDKTTKGTLGGTYPGNPVACAASLATIQYMKDINLNRKAEKIGKVVMDFFNELADECIAIGDVRGLGAMVAFELVKNSDPNQPDSDLCKALINACAAKGLLIISAGTSGNVVRVLSPLVISQSQLLKGLGIIRSELLRLTKK